LRGLCATYTNSAAAQGLQRWDVLPDGERLLKMEPDVPLVSTARIRVRLSDHRDPELAGPAGESLSGYSSQRQKRLDRRPIASMHTRNPRSHR
jgi:hypothetical protein